MAKIDIKQIISSTNNYNFHSHTQFCDGRATMQQILEAAIDCGFEHWGFSPHSPLPVESSCNMSRGAVWEYLDEIGRLREKYGEHINIYASMEVDFLGKNWGAHIPYFQELGLDYMISSVHFVQAKDGTWIDIDGRPDSFKQKMSVYFNNDIRRVVEEFFSQSVKMLELGGFDIVGHIDKIGNNASAFAPGIECQSWYTNLRDGLIEKAINSGVAIEYNTKALRPSEPVLAKLVQNRVCIPVNSDAHTTDKVNMLRSEAIEHIDKLTKATCYAR